MCAAPAQQRKGGAKRGLGHNPIVFQVGCRWSRLAHLGSRVLVHTRVPDTLAPCCSCQMTTAGAHADKTGKMGAVVKHLAGSDAAAVDMVYVVPTKCFAKFRAQSIKDRPTGVHQCVMEVSEPVADAAAPATGAGKHRKH